MAADEHSEDDALFGVSGMSIANNTDALFGSSPLIDYDPLIASASNANTGAGNRTSGVAGSDNFYENLNSGGLFMSSGYRRAESKREHLNSQLDKHGLFSDDSENPDGSVHMFKDDSKNLMNAKQRRASAMGNDPESIKVCICGCLLFL